MAKESILSRLRSKPENSSDEEEKLLQELMELKVKQSQGQLKETHKIREVRKSIAQLKTLFKEQQENKE
ncbi:MAG TPA: 50S ribosomal protein L29 [Gammaproteobacteria bacterium]|jgi:ribosomal protein L29|nr:50S ribosomal protein L29 [Gammaproteobacteria bacterium]HIK72290.1 50S ribosomal protein L29 [Gammaproteobacteria bacterium]